LSEVTLPARMLVLAGYRGTSHGLCLNYGQGSHSQETACSFFSVSLSSHRDNVRLPGLVLGSSQMFFFWSQLVMDWHGSRPLLRFLFTLLTGGNSSDPTGTHTRLVNRTLTGSTAAGVCRGMIPFGTALHTRFHSEDLWNQGELGTDMDRESPAKGFRLRVHWLL